MDVRQFLALRRVTAVAPSPDGSWLAAVVQTVSEDGATWRSHLWKVPLAPGAPARQLTTGEHSDTKPRFAADGALHFLSDRGATRDPRAPARLQVWRLRSGVLEQRTDQPLGVLDFACGDDGSLVVIAPRLPGIPEQAQRQVADERERSGPSALHYHRQPVRHWDRWLGPEVPHFVRVSPGAPRDLTPDAQRSLHEVPWALSPDGRTIAFAPARMADDAIFDRPLRVLDVRTGNVRTLDAPPLTCHDAPRWSPDGGRIATIRHTRSADAHGRKVLCVTEVTTGATRVVSDAWDAWPTPAAWTPDGAGVIVTAPHRGRTGLYVVDAATGAVRALWDEDGTHESVDCAGEHVVGVRHGLLQPPEPFAAPLVGGRPRLLATLSGASPDALARWAEVRWAETPSVDGEPVHHAVVGPTDPGQRGAAVLWVHGGPISQWGDAWHWRWNPLPFVRAGLTIALPNPRGSVGYGQRWVEGIWSNAWGGACADDLLATTDALVASTGVDPSRIGVMGGSFGGWMVNWLCTQSDRFRAAVTHAAIFDHGRMYGDCDSPGEWAWHLGSTPDQEHHHRYAPDRHVARWRTPTLIVHGERDYCVPISQGLALFQTLQQQGVSSELLVFPDEGHWILRPTNIAAWHDAVLAFLVDRLAAQRPA